MKDIGDIMQVEVGNWTKLSPCPLRPTLQVTHGNHNNPAPILIKLNLQRKRLQGAGDARHRQVSYNRYANLLLTKQIAL